METIEQKLDALAEYHSQKDSIDAQKKTLLDDVKVPAEVLQVMKSKTINAREGIKTHPSLCGGCDMGAYYIPDPYPVCPTCGQKMADLRATDHPRWFQCRNPHCSECPPQYLSDEQVHHAS